MKSQMFRVWALGVTISALAFGTGCQADQAQAQEPSAAEDLVPQIAQTPATNPVPEAPKPAEPVGAPDATPGLEKGTNAAPPKMVQNPTMPENLKVSPALAEVIKLAQAGVSDDVMLAYITNSMTTFFNVTSDAIVYLNDLGVSNDVITALIQHDSSPEMQARKQYANAVQPLPPGAAINTPATNIYPPSVTETVPAEPPTTAEAVTETNYVVQTNYVEQPVSVSYFYSSLAPYGSWIEVDGYGLCWQPTVVVSNPRWRPYSDRGRWVWTDCGWYWYSDYSWGWAPFHYGRWCSYPRLGWIWVPDTHWGPSWVSWRWSSGYCGWAPLPPSCYYRPGFGLYYRGGAVSVGFDFGLSWHHYTYVPVNRFCDRSPGLYYANLDQVRRIHNETTVINNYVVGDNNTIVNRGFGRERIAAASRGQVPTASIREVAARGASRREQLVNDGKSMTIVRPTLPERPTPSHVSLGGRTPPSALKEKAVAAGTPRVAAAERERDRSLANTAGRDISPMRRGFAPRATEKVETDRTRPESGTATAEKPETRRITPGSTGSRSARPSIAEVPKGEPTPDVSKPVNSRPDSSPAVRAPRDREERRSEVAANNNNGSGMRQPARVPQTVRGGVPTVTTPAPSAKAPEVAPTPQTRSAPSAARPNTSNGRSEAYRVYPERSTPAPRSINPAPQAPAVRSAPPANVPAARPNLSPPASRAEPARPSVSQPSRPAPSFSQPARPAPSYSQPSRPAPSYSQPSRPAPSYSAPARQAPSYSPPSRPSAPSFSAPPARSSPPANSGGGGGRFGGGRRGDGER